jgi:hypothetical protein
MLYIVLLVDFTSDRALAEICFTKGKIVWAVTLIALLFYKKTNVQQLFCNRTGIPIVISHTFEIERAFCR